MNSPAPAISAAPGLRCVLLPCAGNHTWAVPQYCIAEIVMAADGVSGYLGWRGLEIPVYRPGGGYIDSSGATSALARPSVFVVFFGLRERGCDYWALGLQGHGLTSVDLRNSAIVDRPDLLLPGFLAAFTLAGRACQVPDLPTLQARIAAEIPAR